MRNMGFGELALVFLVIMLLFGSKKVPDLARSLGRSIGEFKKGREEGNKSLTDSSETAKSTQPDSSKTEKD